MHQDEPDEAVNRGSICSRISLQHLYKVFGHHHALTKYLAETEKQRERERERERVRYDVTDCV